MLHIVDRPDSYVQHLVMLSQNFQVSLSEDVKNQLGAVLVHKGKHLDEDLAQKISNHQLSQPLENCVQFDANVDGQTLIDYFQKIFARHATLAQFHREKELATLLESACLYYQRFTPIVQKMTVLKMQSPALFHQALMCGYMSLLIAQKLQMTRRECCWVFLAGLIHNIGILHLDKSVLTNKGEYTSQQWRTMQSHPILAYECLKGVPGLPKEIASAVLEHHECCDGSGYPFNKTGSQLGLMGQIVGISDTCLAVYNRELAHKKLGFDALIPLLKLNPAIYRPKVFAATIALLQDVHWPVTRVYEDTEMQDTMTRLLSRQKTIKHDYQVIYSLLDSLEPHMVDNKKTAMLKRVSQRVSCFFEHSEILQPTHSEWLVMSIKAPQQPDFLTMEKLELSYAEVSWQLKQLVKLLCWLWDKKHFKHPKLQDMVSMCLSQISARHGKIALPQAV
ncbi:MAG: HD domain-containing phosphohydrolase [Bermanella sp.]|jgi:HD-GYP domain